MAKKTHYRVFFVIVLSIISLSGCTGKAATLKKTVTLMAEAMETDFSGVRASLETMVAGIEDVYAKAETLDLSTAKMDKAQGGPFDSFKTENGVIYHTTRTDGCVYYASPADSLITPEIKRQVRLMQYQEDLVIKAYKKNADIDTMSFFGIHKPSSVAILFPYMNVVSVFPPKVDFTYFEWYTRGINAPGAFHWSKAPFADLATGWVMDVAKSVSAGNRVIGTAVISVSMNKLSTKYLLGKESASLMLLGNDLTIIGLTPAAKAILGVKVLEDYDYIKQMKENSFVPDTFKLNGKGQNADILSLAETILSGEKDFTAKTGSVKERFIVEKIAEVGFYVVGMY